jgi:rare lipoprotein A
MNFALFLFCLALTGCKLSPWNWGSHSENGKASWYGNEYDGRKTASGEVFDQWAMTAAHRELPFGTVVLVKNLDNGRTVKVRINDRGPFIRGRIIDLSRGAAERIDLVRDGVAPVRLEVVKWGPA